ncbi:T53G5 protein, partial [Dromaius novaehollandiae]|nr:T53G5 protein [Dromaius novaehollandiae]
LRELSLLKLLKRTNRRVARLHALAVRCWRALRAKGPPCLQPAPAGHLPFASGLREHSPLPEPEGDAADRPVGDADHTTDAAMDPAAGVPPGDPQPGAGRRVAEEAERGLLEALPQRVYMPAPKVLCRPSAQRWVKPCCTRSCGDSLEHARAARYPQ